MNHNYLSELQQIASEQLNIKAVILTVLSAINITALITETGSILNLVAALAAIVYTSLLCYKLIVEMRSKSFKKKSSHRSGQHFRQE